MNSSGTTSITTPLLLSPSFHHIHVCHYISTTPRQLQHHHGTPNPDVTITAAPHELFHIHHFTDVFFPCCIASDVITMVPELLLSPSLLSTLSPLICTDIPISYLWPPNIFSLLPFFYCHDKTLTTSVPHTMSRTMKGLTTTQIFFNFYMSIPWPS